MKTSATSRVRLILPDLGPLRADSFSCHQLPPHKKQVAEREQCEDMRAVLRETAVAGVEVTELALDHAERMLDAGTIWG